MLEWLFGKRKDQPEKKKEKKPKKSQAEQQSEDKWMYQFLVQFLNSPIWRVSILDFVDNNCLVFDSEEQNKFEYTVIHNQFKQLVGNLFDGMMSEVGLDSQKLAELLERGFQSKEKKLFNQLLLCDDFLKFKQLMLKRNRVLQEQAIRAMKGEAARPSKLQSERATIHSAKKHEEQRQKQLEKQEEQILRRTLELSRLEAEEQEAIKRLEHSTEQYELNMSQKQSQEQHEPPKQQHHRQKEEGHESEQKKVQKQDRKQRIRAKLRKEKLESIEEVKKSDLPPLKNPHQRQPQQFNKQPEEGVVEHHQPVKAQQKPAQREEEAPVEAHEERKKRLLEQRQKIRKKKEQERRKQLLESETHHRPQVGNVLLQEDGIHESNIGHKEEVVNQKQDKVSRDEIERRKALMKKIKNRIVDDF